MKKGLLYSIVALAAIVIVASFNMQLGNAPTQTVPESMAGNVLYVCQASDSSWDSVASALRVFSNYIIAGFFFCLVLLAFGWGWQLYQNLLSDKFKRDSFKNIWAFTKWWFWLLAVTMLILFTPNAFRRVSITGAGDNWVMCNASDMCNVSDPNCHNRIVRADAVHVR